MHTSERWRHLRRRWVISTYYQRFESLVAFVLTVLISGIVVVALYRLSVAVIGSLVFGALDPLDHRVFQSIFGEIMTLLIALEFNHTLQYVVAKEESIIQTKVVLLIALLALARKLIIFDVRELSPDQLLGLAAVTLALGITYWLMRERDDRALQAAAGRPATPGSPA